MSMLRFLRFLFALGVLMAGVTTGRAFSLLGPLNEPYQTGLLSFGGLGGPKNLGEEYRWNIPVIYYSFDQSFLDYFGTSGVNAVEQAIAVLNNLPPVSSMSPQLEEWPLSVRRSNFRALQSNLLDLKSSILELLVEQMGLAEPERYTWILHSRFEFSPCPPLRCSYLVQSRNFAISPTDYTVLQISPYVNGAFYSYQIQDGGCGGPADAVEVSPDPFAAQFSAVASQTLASGEFYAGLTRDDAACFRYLLSSNNVNFEAIAPGTSEIPVTNSSPQSLQLLVTSNLAVLASQSLTNDPATLQGLYPDLLIASYVPTFTNVVTTNVTPYYTNYPWAVTGTPPALFYSTNYTTNVTFVYSYQFGNVTTNSYYTNTPVTLLVTNIGPAPWAPAGSGVLLTNVTTTLLSESSISGDYYILPTNQCGVVILSNVLTSVFSTTNLVISPYTNLPTLTNTTGTNSVATYTNHSESYIYYFTNHSFAIFPVVCVSNGMPMLRRGMEKIRFVRRDYDSLLGQFFEPLTNSWVAVGVTNNTNWTQTVRRFVAAPDFLFDASDLNPGPNALPGTPTIARSLTFNQTYILPNLAGPGTIDPPAVFTFNKSGIAWINTTPFLTQVGGSQQYTWASFDGTTNTPILYPNGASITNIENQMIMQVTTLAVPSAVAGTNYLATLAGQGGQPPYVWSLAPSSPGMPPGMVLFSDGTMGGVPTAPGTYDVTVRMSDVGGRYVDQNLVITVLQPSP
jgi:hypothetical protein